jgi:hypothetical protein
MKKLLFSIIAILMAVAASAQKDSPTTSWPYLYPDFMEGELEVRTKITKALVNIHLNLGALHYVEDGKIKESSTIGITKLVIGEDVFRNVGGKMMKILAETEGGYVVEETRANYTAVVKKDGAYGTTALNSTTTKSFLYNENVLNGYNGYLMTDIYADLHAMKDQSETLPVLKNRYLVIGLDQIKADRQNVLDIAGLDKKAFKAFLKAEKIKWDNPQDLAKVIDFITAE